MRDIAGAILSTLCICHCLATPLLALVTGAGGLGMIAAIAEVEWLHRVLLGGAVTVVALSLPAGFRAHRDCRPLLAGTGGVSLMGLALIAGEAFEPLLSTLGAMLVVFAHLANRRLRRSCMVPNA